MMPTHHHSFCCSLLLFGVVLTWGPALAANVQIYRHATLVDATQGQTRTNMAIVVSDGMISAIEHDNAKLLQRFPTKHVVNLQNHYVMPGLIDTHVHLATYPNLKLAHAQLELYLMSGITTVRDMAGDTRLLAELRRELQSHEAIGPDIYFSALMAGPSFFSDPRTQEASHGETAGQIPWMQAIDQNTDIPLAVAQAKGTYATGIKLYANMEAELVGKIVAEANRQHLMVWSHACVFPARPSELIAMGLNSISHAYMLGYETANDMSGSSYQQRPAIDFDKLSVDDERLQALLPAMVANKVTLDATLYVIKYAASNALIPIEKRLGLPAQFAFSLRMVNAAKRAGVMISTGSDVYTGAHFATPGLWSEFETLQQDAQFTPTEIIAAATLNGAKLLRLEQHIGSLEPGKKADFIVLKKNPLLDIRALSSIETTVKNGKAYQRANYHLSKATWRALQ